MATALPAFPEFDVSETSTQATRWKEMALEIPKPTGGNERDE